MLHLSSVRFGAASSFAIGLALMAAAPASADTTVVLSTVAAAPTHLSYYQTGIANGDFNAGAKAFKTTYYLDFLFGKPVQPATALLNSLNLVFLPVVNISSFTTKLFDITTNTLVATANGTYNVIVGNKYSVEIAGKASGTQGGHYTLGIGLTNPVPGPAGIIVALAGAGLIFGRRWTSKGRTGGLALSAA